MKQELCKILEQRELCPGYFYLRLNWETTCSEFIPGQFVEIKINESNDPLLRRPFSIFDIYENSFVVVYRVIGYGTTLLSKKKQGEYLDVIGPLGNGYNLEEEKLKKEESPVLVGGGTGSASLYYCAKKIISKEKSIRVFLGFKNTDDLFCLKEWNNLSVDLTIATEDGSYGKKGFVTDILPLNLDNSVIYACGPKEMFKSLRNRYLQTDVFASFEEYMACGFGICCGCVIKVIENNQEIYKKVCKDGPVFNLQNVIL
ncbi:dihydroorotate dehydrogenase electron transfer subunit [bacterium]